ncbi:MAG: amidohydrolase [Desulfuromusa sp.]|nr:amidohydrolase [Desulfuromusa sp.]
MYTAFLSATIFTPNIKTENQEAILVKDSSIVAVGSNQEIEALCPVDTEKIHLPGCFISPGFVDAHTHVWSLGYTLSMVDLRGLTSLKACQEAIAKAAEKTEPGQWIVGRNWNQNIWKEQREPTRHDLDEVTPDNPTVMIRICGHANWCNTKAFELAGVTATTPEPFGGKIEREPDTNNPAGLIREKRELVEYAIPLPDTKMRKEAFLKCQEIFFSHGITAVHSFETLAEYKILHELEQEGKLKLRIYHTVHEDEQDDFDTWNRTHHSKSDMLWHGHIKMFADGSLGAKSAYLHEPYEGSVNNYGISCMTPEEMVTNVERAYATGRGVIIHAIGDRALTQCLDAIEAARKKYPGSHNDRIEHLQLTRTEDLERMKKMDIGAGIQPVAILTDWEVAEKSWGQQRCKYAYAWKTMADIGLRFLFSSDAPIEPINPMLAIQTAVIRRGTGCSPTTAWYPEQCIDLETALKGYFEHSGWANGKPELFGAITPGKKADLTILGKNPFSMAQDKIGSIQIKMTVVNGKIVYKK